MNKEIVIAPNNWFNYNRPQFGFSPVDIKTKIWVYMINLENITLIANILIWWKLLRHLNIAKEV
jgi:hypothetical protein